MREAGSRLGLQVILWEYSEEHPPLISQPGMATKIRNYFKRKVTEPQSKN